MSLLCKLSGKHYWSIPHRATDQRLVQMCYECGAERPARELHKEATPDPIKRTLASATADLQQHRRARPSVYTTSQGTKAYPLTLVKKVV